MPLTDHVNWRPITPPGIGSMERHIEYWRVLRRADRGMTYDWLIGLKPGTLTVSQSSQIAHVDPQLPLIQTVSGRLYHLIGMPASEGPCSLHVQACVAMLRAQSGQAGVAPPLDVTDLYWARWRPDDGEVERSA